MIACAQWLGRDANTCTRGAGCVCVERGKQRFCTHQFLGGACVICHFNPWKEIKNDRPNGLRQQRNAVRAERRKAGEAPAKTGDAATENPTLDRS